MDIMESLTLRMMKATIKDEFEKWMPLNCRSYFHPEPESEESLAFANIGDKAAWPLIE